MSDIATSSQQSNLVTPGEFLAAIFGDQASEAWVASVDSLEPGRATNSQFFGGRFRTVRLNPEANCYYSVGLVAPGRDKSRKAMHWRAGPVLVLDDVGEKGDVFRLTEAFGLPSFIVRTSPSSEQWGYILRTPVTDPLVMARLLRACTLAFYPGGHDPGHEPIVQYMRLPYGANTKAKRLVNGVAPQVTLGLWQPDRKFEVLDLILALDEAWDRAEQDVGHAHSGEFVGVKTEAEAREAADEILLGLDRLGMVHWDHVQNGGYISVECPWSAEHTVGDDRTGYNPKLASRGEGFSCFHTAHGPKSDHDVREWLSTHLEPDVWREINAEAYRAKVAEAGDAFPDNVEEMNQLVRDLRQELRAARTQPVVWREFGAGVPVETLPARKTICPWLIRGEVTIMAAQPGTGKSLLSIAVAMAVSADRADLIGEPRDFDRSGEVVIVSNEDPFDEVMRRRNAWLKHHGITWDALKHRNWTNGARGIRIVERLDRRAPIVATEELKQLGTRIEATRAEGRDVCLVIFDTTATVFSGIEENDNAAVAQAMTVVSTWAQTHNVAVLMLHHMPKAAGKSGGSGDLLAIRGASSMGAAARYAVTLTALSDAEEQQLPDGERGRWVCLRGAKASFNRVEGARWFYKVGVNMDADDDRSLSGTVHESAGVIEYRRGKPPVMFDPAAEAVVLAALTLVRDGDENGRPYTVTRRPKGYTALVAALEQKLGCRPSEAEAIVVGIVDSKLIRMSMEWSEVHNKVNVYVLTEQGEKLLKEKAEEVPL